MASEPDELESLSMGELGVLTSVFGTHPKVKILIALLSEDWHDITVRKIAELAGIDESTVYPHIEDLVDLSVVHATREVAGSQLYQINRNSSLAKMIKNVEEEILEQQSEKVESQQEA